MLRNNILYGQQFDSKVVGDLKDIDKKISEEVKKGDQASKEEILKLRTEKLYRGMELNSGIGFNNSRRGIPY